MNFEDKEPDRRYFSIKEVCKQLDLNLSTLRFWEKQFPNLTPRKYGKGDRLYTHEDISFIRLIHYLLKEKGYTIEGAKKVIQSKESKEADQLKIIQRLEKVHQFLKEMRKQL